MIHSRITNDERTLRRVIKKFHHYAAAAHPLADKPAVSPGSEEDAREAFLIELASFKLQLKKAVLVCEAEARQVEEYQRERQRIGACVPIISLMLLALCVFQRTSVWR